MGGWDGENPRNLGSAVQTHRRKAFTSVMWVMLLNGLLKKEAFEAGHREPTPLIPAFWRQNQSELCEFEVTVQVTVRAWSTES